MDVYFRRFGATTYPSSAYIMFTPRDIRWNDFGKNYHTDIEIRITQGGPIFSCRGLLMPMHCQSAFSVKIENSFNDWLKRKIALTDSAHCLFFKENQTWSESGPKFIVLLEGDVAYQSLANYCQQSTATIELLTSINDLGYLLNNNKLNPTIKEELLSSEEFILGFMRRGSAYRALHRGYKRALMTYSCIDDAKIPFSYACKLQGFNGAAHTLTVEFKPNKVIDDRIHCLVGKNGCGKTRLLRELIVKLATLNDSIIGANCLINNNLSTSEGENVYQGRPIRRVLCYSLDSQTPFPSGARVESMFEYIYTNLSLWDDKTINRNTASTSNDNLTRLLVDIIRSEDPLQVSQYERHPSRFELLRDSVGSYVDLSAVMIPLQPGTNIYGVSVDARGRSSIDVQQLAQMGEKASLELLSAVDFSQDIGFRDNHDSVPLSSGHRVFFKFAVSFLSYIDFGTLVILDEPETHLHPNLVCDFMNLLYSVLSATKSVALIATHSAYVVREVPTHCAHIYTLDENKSPSENAVYLRTLGANIENISQAVFADSNARKYHQGIARQILKENMTLEEVIREYAEIMSPDLLSRVAQLMDKDIEDEGGNEN